MLLPLFGLWLELGSYIRTLLNDRDDRQNDQLKCIDHGLFLLWRSLPFPRRLKVGVEQTCHCEKKGRYPYRLKGLK
jgi:hypothetical protein